MNKPLSKSVELCISQQYFNFYQKVTIRKQFSKILHIHPLDNYAKAEGCQPSALIYSASPRMDLVA